MSEHLFSKRFCICNKVCDLQYVRILKHIVMKSMHARIDRDARKIHKH